MEKLSFYSNLFYQQKIKKILTIQKIICGFSPLDEIEYSILQETFQTSNIHNMLGCSVLGIWAIQSNELCGTLITISNYTNGAIFIDTV